MRKTMPSLTHNLMEICSPSLSGILLGLGIGGVDVVGKQHIKYLDVYLLSIGAKCAVIEHEYIDRDYLEDYTRYYSRCFKAYKRECERVHFFSKEYSAEEMKHALLDEDGSGRASMQDSYLGFVVLRPLQRTIIGRTCLRPYAELDGRHYKALCDVSVSFFGVHLNVRCMPFQEQDSTVAACATCALWSAFQVTADFFQHAVYTPGRITELATSHGLSSVRSLPNGSGLTTSDILYAIRHVGLDPVVVKANDEVVGVGKSVILGNVYSYLGLGISVVVLGEIVGEGGKKMGGHAITVNGYHLTANNNVRGCGSSKLRAGSIDKLYVHDDQLGPYARAEIQDDGVCGRWLLKHDDAQHQTEIVKLFVPKFLVIPVYQKIRVSYDEVWTRAYEFDRIICVLPELRGAMEWDITLRASNCMKVLVRQDTVIPSEERFRFLTTGLPKYVWELTLYCNGNRWAMFCIDATDSGQGLNVAASVFYSVELPDMVTALCEAMPSLLSEPLCRACVRLSQ